MGISGVLIKNKYFFTKLSGTSKLIFSKIFSSFNLHIPKASFLSYCTKFIFSFDKISS